MGFSFISLEQNAGLTKRHFDIVGKDAPDAVDRPGFSSQ
jgi:hypothetical protein